MRLVRLSLIPFILSCATKVPLPQGDLCIFDAANLRSICKPMSPALVKFNNEMIELDSEVLKALSYDAKIVPAKDMENWIATDPKSWAEVQLYINRLKAAATCAQ